MSKGQVRTQDEEYGRFSVNGISRDEKGATPDVRWEKIFSEYLTRYDIRLPENPGILNIGCGNNVKWNYLGTVLYLGTRGLGLPYYVAVDHEEKAFSDAKKAMDGLIHFLTGDAQHLTDFLAGTYHLAIFEHPNLSTSREAPKIWRQIFRETATLLDINGGLILTSFWLNDHIPAQVAMERAGFTIVHSGKNKFPGKIFDTSHSGESLQFDKYILIAKKAS